MCSWSVGRATHFLTLVCARRRGGRGNAFPMHWLAVECCQQGLGSICVQPHRYVGACVRGLGSTVCVSVGAFGMRFECQSFDAAVTLWPYH